jgi:CheY-like chemotaxis protein
MRYLSPLRSGFMADQTQHAIVFHSDSQVALPQQRRGPLANMVAEALSLAVGRESSFHERKLTILIADDDRPLLNYLAELLAPNFWVTIASTGVAASERLLASDYDVIVCNVTLPELRGEDVYFRAKKTKPHQCERFIFTTAFGEFEEVRGFIDSVERVLLHKPVRLDQWDNALLIILKQTQPLRFRSVESVFVL